MTDSQLQDMQSFQTLATGISVTCIFVASLYLNPSERDRSYKELGMDASTYCTLYIMKPNIPFIAASGAFMT
jgi:hypothetical protein